MILFLNFAPIEFMGGAEKWMNQTAGKVNKYESTRLISTAPEIANVYGSLVLKRKFKKRSRDDIQNHSPITYASLIPFSEKWQEIRDNFNKSRLIYAKYEIPEMLIILYFGGLSSFKKTIAGIHSPFLYNSPRGFFSNLHNYIYGSSLNSKILSKVKKIHVLNKRDAKLMSENLELTNVEYVPNGTDSARSKKSQKTADKKILNILTVGELSQRKGTDILIQIIKKSPENFKFTIIGDGPMKEDVESVQKQNPRVKYKGFINPKEVGQYYQQNDVLLLPSRAESMSLALLEAIAHGLTIINSKETSLDLDKKVEYSNKEQTPESYIKILEKFFNQKTKNKTNKKYIQNYFQKNFSPDIVNPQLFKNIFELNL